MMSVILRQTASMASKRTLSAAAAASMEALLHHRLYQSSSSTGVLDFPVNDVLRFQSRSGKEPPLGFGAGARGFHRGLGDLEFRASSPLSKPEYAVAEYSDEDKLSKSASDEGLEISKLGISEEIVAALAKKGITKLFPIQRAVLDPAMKGRDMIGRARTGTGKTLAFGIPILDKIIKFNAKHGRGLNPLALVLAPTRELAKQVDKEFYESAPNLDTICVYGGTPIARQMDQLRHGVDIVVGTPGRIIDLLKRGSLNLSEVQFVVLDEADQMLNVGFEEDVEVILSKLPQKRQSLMFSATMPTWIRNLTQKYLSNPLTIDLVGDSDQKLADGISLYSIVSDPYGKASIIGSLITEHANGGKCIVFTQTKRDADRLAYAMGKKFNCEPLHGDITQHQRERTLSGFRAGRFNVLVATDVAARGLDVPNVDLVIHYELPNNSEIFVHRSGRTGRAGKKGTAILIYSDEQLRNVKLIEREVGCKFTQLPRIAVDEGDKAMFSGMGSGSGFGRSGYSRSGGYGNSGFGRSGGYGSSGGYGNSGSGRSGGYGSSGGYGNSGGFGSSGGYGSGRSGSGFNSSSNRSGGFEGFGSGRSGSDRSSGFDSFGSGRSSGFGDGHSSKSTGSSRFGSFGSFGDDTGSKSF